MLGFYEFLRQWSSETWIAGCLISLGVTTRLWQRTHSSRKKLQNILDTTPGEVRLTLRGFERLALSVIVYSLFLLAIGVLSELQPAVPLPPGIPFWRLVYGAGTLIILVLLPFYLTWVIFKAFRLYEG